MSDIKPFVPNLIKEPVSYFDFLTPGIKHPSGSKVSTARVVSNDGEWVTLCDEYSNEHCRNCEVSCPFNKNPNRKEA